MSDLAATNCGCDNGCNGDRRGNGFFGGNCSCIIWILILFSLCGHNKGFGDGCGCGCGDNSCILLILLLLCGCGEGWGNGCGCGF